MNAQGRYLPISYNDVPENLEETGFQSSINDDTPLGQFARTRKRLKAREGIKIPALA